MSARFDLLGILKKGYQIAKGLLELNDTGSLCDAEVQLELFERNNQLPVHARTEGDV